MSKRRSANNKHGVSTSTPEATGWGYAANTGFSDAASIGISSDRFSAHSQMRVRHVVEEMELRIRDLARHFTVAEFISIRAKVEDAFDTVLFGRLS